MKTHVQYIVVAPADTGWSGEGWYFWDETSANCYGPYGTEGEAVEGFKAYVERLSRP